MTPRPPSPIGPAWARWVGRLLAKVVWATRVAGADNFPKDGPVICVANHTGVIDGPLVLGVAPRPLHILVKEELFAGPIGLVLKASGQIPVDRSSGREALVKAAAVLHRGGAVGVFPEGNRGRGDAASARAGAAWLALNAPAPVLPVAVLGTRRTGEGAGHIPGPRRRLYVEFGRPFSVERLPATTGRRALENANKQVRAALADLVNAASEHAGIPLPEDSPNHHE